MSKAVYQATDKPIRARPKPEREANMELNYTAPAAPSITSSAMLVELMISVWTGKKRDKAASEEVSRNKNADKGVASVNKKLLGDCAELDALQKFSANVRNMHYHATLPWSDMGPRLLTTTRYFKYNADFTALQAEFGRLVDTFLAAYDWEIMQSQAKLGDLFDVTEYPSGDDLRNKFRFKLKATCKRKDGVEFSQKPVLKAPDGSDLNLRPSNGSLAKVAYEIVPFYNPALGCGVQLRLRGVKVTQLVEYSKGGDNMFGSDNEEVDNSEMGDF